MNTPSNASISGGSLRSPAQAPCVATFITAASKGDVAAVKGQLSLGVDINAVAPPCATPQGAPAGMTALHYACRNGHMSVVTALLERGSWGGAANQIKFEAVNSTGKTALGYAKERGHSDIHSLLSNLIAQQQQQQQPQRRQQPQQQQQQQRFDDGPVEGIVVMSGSINSNNNNPNFNSNTTINNNNFSSSGYSNSGSNNPHSPQFANTAPQQYGSGISTLNNNNNNNGYGSSSSGHNGGVTNNNNNSNNNNNYFNNNGSSSGFNSNAPAHAHAGVFADTPAVLPPQQRGHHQQNGFAPPAPSRLPQQSQQLSFSQSQLCQQMSVDNYGNSGGAFATLSPQSLNQNQSQSQSPPPPATFGQNRAMAAPSVAAMPLPSNRPALIFYSDKERRSGDRGATVPTPMSVTSGVASAASESIVDISHNSSPHSGGVGVGVVGGDTTPTPSANMATFTNSKGEVKTHRRFGDAEVREATALQEHSTAEVLAGQHRNTLLPKADMTLNVNAEEGQAAADVALGVAGAILCVVLGA